MATRTPVPRNGLAEPLCAAGAVDLWWLSPLRGAVDEEAFCADVLTEDEFNRAARYVREADRSSHRLAWALARRSLSWYAPVPPSGWRFRRDTYGKPQIAGLAGPHPLHFNLSHCDGAICCAVSATPVGVDVERMRGGLDPLALAHQFFAPDEILAFGPLAPGRRITHFFSLWVLKEAYVKARGEGLSIPLDQFSFGMLGEDVRRIRLSAVPDDESAAWHFALVRPCSRHLVAVAQRSGPGNPITLSCKPGAMLVH